MPGWRSHAAGLSSPPGQEEHDVPMDTRERLLPLVGASNFRDLGGYPTTDGGLTRWGELFRSDTLHELTEADLEVLRGVGLATVIDLRTATERDRSGRGLLGQEDGGVPACLGAPGGGLESPSPFPPHRTTTRPSATCGISRSATRALTEALDHGR